MKRVRNITIGLVLFGTTMALAQKPYSQDELRLHTIVANNDGGPLDAKLTTTKNGELVGDHERVDDEAWLNERVGNILSAMQKTPVSGDGKKHILIFIHGGMNKRDGKKSSIVRSAELGPILEKEANCYPIFIDWNSDPFSCYGDHLFRVRQGIRRQILGPWTSPICFATDVARGVARAPLTWIQLAENASSQPGGFWTSSNNHIRMVFAHEALKYRSEIDTEHSPGVTQATIGDIDYRDGSTSFAAGTAHVLGSPTKTIGAFVLDMLGTGAWDIMLRRANELFDSPTHYNDLKQDQKADLKELVRGEL